MLKIWNSIINDQNKSLNILFMKSQSTSNILSRRKRCPIWFNDFPSAAPQKFIRRIRFSKHTLVITFLELHEAPASVNRFKIYGPSLLTKRGTEGKFIQRKNQDTWARKAQLCYCCIFQQTQSIMVQMGMPSWEFSHLEQKVWIFNEKSRKQEKN